MWRYLFALAFFQAVFCATGKLQFLLSSDNDVSNQPIDIPSDTYNGTFTGFVTPLPSQDLLLCINWLVPAEAPMVNLSTVWPAVCDFTQYIPRNSNDEPVSFTAKLRSGSNYFSMTAFDLDSVGVVPVDMDYDDGSSCASGSLGPSCAPYTAISYSQDVPVTNSVQQQFWLPTFVNSSKNIQNLKFNVKNNLANATISYRLSGPVIPGVYDGQCTDLTKACVIQSPPLTRSNSFWIITVTAANLSFSVTPTICSNNIGSSCKTILNDGTKLKNSVTQFSGAQYFTFPGPIFDVAVGGLDGYAQTAYAPNMTLQIDNVPIPLVLSSGINAQSNRLTINMTGSPVLNNNSQFIVFVDAKGSFGIWIPDENSICANNCSGRGSCDDFVCTCPSESKNEYNGLGCEHEVKSFTIEYVILIAVGGLLVLSIVIGVPVYCWMNRHSDYETVA